MVKERGRQVFAARRASQRNRRDPISILLFITLLALILGVLIYERKFYINTLVAYSSSAKQFMLRIAEHRAASRHSAAKTKTHALANRQDAQEPEVHFEFYTTLADASPSVPAPQNTLEKKPQRVAEKKAHRKVSEVNEVITEASMQQDLQQTFYNK